MTQTTTEIVSGTEYTNSRGQRVVVEGVRGEWARIRTHVKPVGCGRGKGRVIRRLAMVAEIREWMSAHESAAPAR